MIQMWSPLYLVTILHLAVLLYRKQGWENGIPNWKHTQVADRGRVTSLLFEKSLKLYQSCMILRMDQSSKHFHLQYICFLRNWYHAFDKISKACELIGNQWGIFVSSMKKIFCFWILPYYLIDLKFKVYIFTFNDLYDCNLFQ